MMFSYFSEKMYFDISCKLSPIFSRKQALAFHAICHQNILSYFPRKQDLTFPANCLLNFSIFFFQKEAVIFRANCLLNFVYCFQKTGFDISCKLSP